MNNPENLSSAERHGALSFSKVLTTHTLRLFMILLVFRVYIMAFSGATATLAILAISLPQSILRRLSDRTGHISVGLVGVLRFASASVWDAMSQPFALHHGASGI